ncbi:Arginine exporter protein ArgO [compost metagenome]
MIQAIIHGFILALGLILPLGVQNLFVFNQGAVQPHFVKSLPAIITASICDTLLISLAILGVSVVVLENDWIRILLYSLGICFLVYMGSITWKNKPAEQKQTSSHSYTPKKQIIFALSVSLLNPHAVMDTIGVIGTSSINYAGVDKAAFAVVCIATSWFWFIGLGIAGRSAGRMDQSVRFLTMVNTISAFIMWGTAAYLGYRLWLLV